MAFCKVNDMDVISDAGSVRSIVIVAKNTQLFQLANCNLCDVRHQIVRNTVWILTDQTALVSTDRVEITQQNNVPFRICFLDICQNLFQHGFRPAVRVCALSLRALLGDRDHRRISVHGCRRGKDDILHIVLAHYINQGQRACNIVFIVFPGLLYGFADCL